MTLLVPLVMLLFALYAHVLNDMGPLDMYTSPQPSSKNSRHFSVSYYEARALFRTQAAAAKAALVTRPLEGLDSLDVSVDFALLPGASDRVVVHVSGTHGVEGFAGSAIQSALLERIAATAGDSGGQEDDPTRPTVILVHALNAYGFAQVCDTGSIVNTRWLPPLYAPSIR